MLEVEVKGVVPDWNEAIRRVEAAGGALTFAGRLEDRRYDTADRALRSHDVVLRLRVYRTGAESRAELDWKGPTSHEGGYKRREELGAHIVDAGAFDEILHRLGYEVTVAIDREIRQYTLLGATVRFERYPRMDDLVEVEGAPDAIERAIAALGLERGAFTSERLPQFVRRFEARTGQVAALADAELAGTTHFDPANA